MRSEDPTPPQNNAPTFEDNCSSNEKYLVCTAKLRGCRPLTQQS